MDKIILLKNRGAICFSALLLGLFSIASSDTDFYFRSREGLPRYTKFAEVWDNSSKSWVQMTLSGVAPYTSSYFSYSFKSSEISSPIVIRSIDNLGNAYCFETTISKNCNAVYESSTDTLFQAFVVDGSNWTSFVYVPRTNHPYNYQPPYVSNLGFSMDGFVDSVMIALGVGAGVLIGGILAFVVIWKIIRHSKGVSK